MELLRPLELPPYPFKISEKGGQFIIFDPIRKKELVLTPEEWVRQHFVQFLINQKKYPRGLIRLEGGHKLLGKTNRSDIVVYNSAGEKILLVECKAPSVRIDQQTFDQVARYNMVQKAPLLAVTNGLEHYYCRIHFEKGEFTFLGELPDYLSL